MGNNKKNQDRELFDMLRGTGLRKKVARTVSASTAQANNGDSSKTFPSEVAHQTVRGLRMAAAAIENRMSNDSTGHDRKTASSGRIDKRSAGHKRTSSAARGAAKKASAQPRAGRKTSRPATTKTARRKTASRNPRARARTGR